MTELNELLREIRERSRRAKRPDRDDVPREAHVRVYYKELKQAERDRDHLLSLLPVQPVQLYNADDMQLAFERFRAVADPEKKWDATQVSQFSAAFFTGWRRREELAHPAASTPTEPLRELLERWSRPCTNDCEHSHCPLLRKLWTLVEDARIKGVLVKAGQTVKPIVDKERESENIGDLMNLRLDAAASTEAQDKRTQNE